MTRSRLVLGACVVCVALPALAIAQQPGVEPVRTEAVADKLGTKLLPSAPRELELGHSATMTLAEPKKLEEVGIKGMHEGARVTITCVGPSRVRVEADEMEPVEHRAVVTLRVRSDGALVTADDPLPPPKPPAPKPPRA